jgi:hypothetical protein
MKTPTSPIRRVTGAFNLLRKHAREMAVLGLVGYADAGARAAGEITVRVTANSSANKSAQANLASDLEAMLHDGVINASELARLKVHKKALRHCVERSEDNIAAVTIS